MPISNLGGRKSFRTLSRDRHAILLRTICMKGESLLSSFQKLTTLDDIHTFLETNTLAFIYISQENCSVCHGLLPQVEQLMEAFPHIKTALVKTDELPAIAGDLSIFTVPVLLLFVEGKESIREARIVHLDELEKKLSSIYAHFHS